MKYLRDFSKKDLSDDICLLRVDLNLKSLNDFFRLTAIIPTLKFLLKRKAKILILSHRGRPKKQFSIFFARRDPQWNRDNFQFSKAEKKYRLSPIGKILAEKLSHKITFLPSFNFAKIKNILKTAPPSSIFLLENLRFLKEEEGNSAILARQLASMGTLYINDAFAVSHRKNASLVSITKFLPSYAGLLLEKEIKNLSRAVINPQKPLTIILGGSKINDKIGVINNLLKKTDSFLLGSSALNDMNGSEIKKLLNLENKKIIFPIDGIKNGDYRDIGSKTIVFYNKILKKSKTIIWNGPVGQIEKNKYVNGSIALAKTIVNSKAFSVVGGGETTNLILRLKFDKKIGFLSTGGGAMLDFFAGKKLPAIEALK